jgi:hypothetical protein
MSRKQHIVLAALFVAVNLIGAALNTPARTPAPPARAEGRALAPEHYEDASDAELWAASLDEPIVCVAASTSSGCG